MARIFIGTSGFSYPHWGKGVFYPPDLPQRDWFLYYTKQFDTVELNVSFYRLPKKETFVNWRKRAGPPAGGFVFAVKGSRFITHIKRLKDCQEPVKRFFQEAEGLREALVTNFSLMSARKNKKIPRQRRGTSAQIRSKLSLHASIQKGYFPPNVVLWQLPPRFKANPERLAEFLVHLRGVPQAQHHLGGVWRHAFEFRDESWLNKEIYDLLQKHNAAIVFQDNPGWPITNKMTADFIYLRFHGRTHLYSSCYTEKELKNWAKKIKNWQKRKLAVYAYFNNDALGYAIENAQTLKKLCSKKR